MIGRVEFVRVSDGLVVRPWEDYGLYLKRYAIEKPRAKVLRQEIDGRNGALDLSEWAGAVKYADRTITVELRDMYCAGDDMYLALNGQRVRVAFSDDPDAEYEGRVDAVVPETLRRVTDYTLTLICSPYRYRRTQTRVTSKGTASRTVALKSAGRSVVPVITCSASGSIAVSGRDYSVSAGDNTLAALVVTSSGVSVVVNVNGTVSFAWRDGVIG